MAQLLTISSLTSPRYSPTSPPLWTSLSFSLPPSSILVLRGPSGSGKSVLLKCIAKLLLYPPPGEIRLHGQTACEMGVPEWRSKVLYIPQRAAMLPGTPAEFWTTVTGFRARASRMGKEEIEEGWRDPREIAESWGIGRGAWEQSWGSLSGGEAQRIALAVGVALRPEVLLLDEPTSSLDATSTALVEATLLAPDKYGRRQACIWSTHSDEQAKRVADATLVIGKPVANGRASGE